MQAALRAAKLIRYVADGHAYPTRALDEALKLPSDVFPVSKRFGKRPQSPVPAPPARARPEAQQELWQRLAAFQLARLELEQVREQFGSEEQPIEVAPTDQSSASSWMGRVSRVLTRSNRKVRFVSSKKKWQLPEQVRKNLSPKTRDTLQQAGVDLERDSVPRVLEKLDERMQQAGLTLFEQHGLSSVRAFGKALSGGRKKELANAPNTGNLLRANTPLARSIVYLPEAGGHAGAAVEGTDGSDIIELVPETFRVLGIGELLTLEQTLLRYDAGELAHIENVLRGESKERSHRRLRQHETIDVRERERETTDEHDLKTTERFELQRESEKTIQEDMKLQAGLTVTASYGPVQIGANASFAYGRSTVESTRTASNYARDVTERSLKRIREQVKEHRTVKTLTQVEELSKHGFDNVGGTDHISGLYRFVDKTYRARIKRWGRRLMLEFMVPEPGAFFRAMQQSAQPLGVTLEEPEPPGDLSPDDLEEWNYALWVRQYRVEDLEPPPPRYKIAATTLKSDPQDGPGSAVQVSSNLKAPTGYRAVESWVGAEFIEGNFTAGPVSFSYIGSSAIRVGRNRWTFGSGVNLVAPEAHGEDDIIPIAFAGSSISGMAAAIEVRCERTTEHFRAWQLKAFQAIMTTYLRRKTEYDEQVRAAQIDAELAARSPERNRDIERTELKKSCISLLRLSHFEDAGALSPPTPPLGAPEMHFWSVSLKAPAIQFFETAFEWEQMTYVFYPYFWGRKAEWGEAFAVDDADPLFSHFLRAGAARVVVPVRPAFTEAVLFYVEAGEIWMGASPPVIGDPMYVSVVDQLAEQRDAPQDGVPVGDPWEYRVPTDLIYLENGATQLPSFEPLEP